MIWTQLFMIRQMYVLSASIPCFLAGNPHYHAAACQPFTTVATLSTEGCCEVGLHNNEEKLLGRSTEQSPTVHVYTFVRS